MANRRMGESKFVIRHSLFAIRYSLFAFLFRRRDRRYDDRAHGIAGIGVDLAMGAVAIGELARLPAPAEGDALADRNFFLRVVAELSGC